MRRASTVVLAACRDYDRERVLTAVRMAFSSFDIAGIARDTAAAGTPVLLKPNLLMAAAPEKGVTTHPAVFAAVARVLEENGARLTFGDSPNLSSRPLAAARRCGLREEADALGIPLADFENGEEVSYPQGLQDRRFTIARGALEAGAIVNLPRLKTHAFTVMTGALKNTFGVVPGGRKAGFHLSHPNMDDFSRMIVDLNGLVRSRLVVLDAVKAMQGNGPGSGELIDVGLLIVSDDPVAADAVGCRIMGIDPLSVPQIRSAHESGLGNAHPESIDLRGENLEHYVQRGFKMPPRTHSLRRAAFRPADRQGSCRAQTGDRCLPVHEVRRVRDGLSHDAEVHRPEQRKRSSLRFHQMHPLLLLPGNLPTRRSQPETCPAGATEDREDVKALPDPASLPRLRKCLT